MSSKNYTTLQLVIVFLTFGYIVLYLSGQVERLIEQVRSNEIAIEKLMVNADLFSWEE